MNKLLSKTPEYRDSMTPGYFSIRATDDKGHIWTWHYATPLDRWELSNTYGYHGGADYWDEPRLQEIMNEAPPGTDHAVLI